MDKLIDDRQSYYAAAILSWVKENKKDFFTLGDIQNWRAFEWDEPVLVNQDLLNGALKQLAELGGMNTIPDEYGPTVYEVDTTYMIDRLGEVYGNSPFYKASRYGLDWVLSAVGNINSVNHGELSSGVADDEGIWTPIKVEIDDPIASEAIKLAEDALSVIEGNNGYAQSEPEERNSIVSAIKGTIESIRSGAPSKKVIVEGLIAPLKYISKKFADAAMGKAAQAAVTILVKWIFGT